MTQTEQNIMNATETNRRAWWRWGVTGIILVGALIASALIAMRILFTDPPPPAAPGLQLAAQLRAALQSETAVATTTYIPGDGLFIYTYLPDGNPDEIRAWAGSYLVPLDKQLVNMPANERLRWVIETGDPPNRQETLTASLTNVYQVINLQSQISQIETEIEIETVVIEPTAVPQSDAPEIVIVNTTEPEFIEPAGTVITLDQDTVVSDQEGVWQTVQGEWITENGQVIQTEIGQYDRIALYRSAWMRPSYSLTANMRVDDGEMGAGLVFNAQSVTDKTRAQMVSFTADGEYLQWGYFDETGLFIFQNGSFVTGLIDGRDFQTIKIEVADETYAVTLNDTRLTDNAPLIYSRGYVGLFANLSVTTFDSITLIGEAITPE